MSDTRSHSIAKPAVALPLERERSKAEPAAEANAQQVEWAALLARRVQAEFHRVSGSADTDVASAEKMTALRSPLDGIQTAETAGVSLGSPLVGPEPPISRMMGELNIEGFGQVRFALYRENNKLNVVLGVENAQQRALLQLERSTLLHTLEQSGLKVASVSVTTPEAAGTAFAQSRSVVPRTHGEAHIHAYRQRHNKHEDPDSELSLIG